MKIGIYVSGLAVQKGYENNVSGHLQIALKSCDVLSHFGHEVHLIGTMHDGYVMPACMPADITVHTVTDGKRRANSGGNSLQSIYRRLDVIRQVSEIRALGKQLKLDVLHLFGFEETLKLGAVLAISALNIPVVVTLYGPISGRRWRFLYKRITSIATATAYVKRESEKLGVRVRQIPHGVVRHFTAPRAPHPHRVLFWRDGTEKNGADMCLNVFQQLSKEYPQFSFDMALRFNPIEIPSISDYAQSNANNTNVFRFPYPSDCNLDQLLSEAICVVLPFRNLSIHPQLAIAESLAYGIPTICADIESCSELVEFGVNGYLIPAGDEQALANAIRKVLDDPVHARQMGVTAATRFSTEWNWECYGTKLNDLYCESVGTC